MPDACRDRDRPSRENRVETEPEACEIYGIDEGPHLQPLALDREQMRALGYRTVDALVDWLNDDDAPALRRATPAEMAARLGTPAPEVGIPFDDALATLFRDVLPFTSRSAHPRFFAYVPFAGTWPGALGDFVASACNVYAGSWQEAAGPTQLELEILGWFKQWVGYPATAAGSLVTGRLCREPDRARVRARAPRRRDARRPRRSTPPIRRIRRSARAARTLGFRPDQVRVLPVDDDLRLRPATLADAIAVDERDGPAAASASSRTPARRAPAPSTRSRSSPTSAVNAVLWLHVDAAYGGFAVLTERGRAALGELGLADSITLDPHKWLYQPYECGCVLVRDGRALRHAFETHSDYLRDSEVDDATVNFADYGLQLTRASRAFKLWLSLRTFGVGAFRAAIDRSPRPRRARAPPDRGERPAGARGAAVARHRLLPARDGETMR